MAYIIEKIRKLADSGTGTELWRVRTNEGVVTEASYPPGAHARPILHRPVIEAEREKET